MTHNEHGNVFTPYYSGEYKKFIFGNLPLLKVTPNTGVYVLNILGGNPNTIVEYAKELKRLYHFYSEDYEPIHGVVTAEGKSIPLVYEFAKLLDVDYTVLRKSKKPYMGGKVLNVSLNNNTITTDEEQKLYLANKDVVNLVQKRLIFVDDVISSGATLNASIELVGLAGGSVVGCACLAIEGNFDTKLPIIYIGHLPIVRF